MTALTVRHVENDLPVGGEFQGHNGDCAEYALMAARRANDGVSPTTGAELQRLTNLSIGAGEAGPAGQMTDANLVWLCRQEGLAYLQVGFTEPMLRRYAGRAAMTCGFANGQALPGNEQNVFRHCVAVLDTVIGFDGAESYTLANGDSTAGRAGKLDECPLAQLLAAQPTTLTILIGGATLNVEDTGGAFTALDATHWKASNGHIVQLGLLQKYRSDDGYHRLGLPVEEEQFNVAGMQGVNKQAFERGILVYDPAHHLDMPPGGDSVYYGHADDSRLNGPYGVVSHNAPVVQALTTQVAQVMAVCSQIDTSLSQIK